MASGKLLIHMYLPEAMLDKNVDEMDMEEFLGMVAMADYARKMRTDDLEAGVLKALGRIMTGS